MKQLAYRNEHNARVIAAYWNKSLNKKDWYEIKNQTDDENTDILIYDIIGWPFVEASQFVRDLQSVKTKKITVRVNSPGGDLFDGIAIFNALQNHNAKVITRVEGLAASIASIISMAGHERQAYSNTMMMIHEPMGFVYSNQYDMRETADILAQTSESLIDIYAKGSKIGKKELKQMMKDETWMKAKEMKSNGFIDTILEGGEGIKNKFDLTIYNKLPEEITGESGTTKRGLEKALRDAGLSQNHAKAVLSGGYEAIGKEESDPEFIEAMNNLIQKMGGK